MTGSPGRKRQVAPADGDADRVAVMEVTTARELSAHRPEWEALASIALVPNVFFEPLMLLPALRYLRGAADVRVLLVWAHRRSAPPVLAALLPYERRRRWRGLPIPVHRLWQYVHCYSTAPLLHPTLAGEALAAALDHLSAEGPLLELPDVPGEGPFQHVMVEALRARGAQATVLARDLRAWLEVGADAGSYLAGALSARRRKELRRQERRLAEQGTLTYDALAAGDDLTTWLDDFLLLEAKGWKGRAGTALGANLHDRAFFAAVAHEARAQGRLHMLALRLAGRPLAMKVSLLSGDGAFAFKIAYDEAFARFSPGVLLEIDNLGRAHAAGMKWFDSCAAPDHPMIDRLWRDRVALETLLVALSRRAEPLVAAAPFLLWAGRAWKKRGGR